MIDTAIVKFPISPTPRQLQEWVRHPLIFPDGMVRDKFFQSTILDNKASLHFVYYPPNPKYPIPALLIQASLPNVLFGNNVELITRESEIEETIAVVNGFISRLKWMPAVDFGAGIIGRVDAPFNYQVGERGQDYITALFKLTYPDRKTRPYQFEGVQYRSDSRHPVAVASFYDKYKESLNPSALGYLRHEASLRGAYYVGRRMGVHAPTLRDVTITWLMGLLQNDLEKLRLKDTLICGRSLAFEILWKQYGWKTAKRLHEHLVLRQTMTREQMIAYGDSKSSIRRWEKQIADAGVSLAMIDMKAPLPPLVIEVPCSKMSGSRK